MFNSRKSNTSWIMMSSAMVGGFLLGLSYNKYGKDIKHRIQRVRSNGNGMIFDDYMNSHEPDA